MVIESIQGGGGNGADIQGPAGGANAALQDV